MVNERSKINYKPLWKMLIDMDISKTQLTQIRTRDQDRYIVRLYQQFIINILKNNFGLKNGMMLLS